METLVKFGADVNSRRMNDGWTPLFLATIFGYSYKAQYLIDSGADVLLCDDLGWTPEDWAVNYSLVAVSKIIRGAPRTVTVRSGRKYGEMEKEDKLEFPVEFDEGISKLLAKIEMKRKAKIEEHKQILVKIEKENEEKKNEEIHIKAQEENNMKIKKEKSTAINKQKRVEKEAITKDSEIEPLHLNKGIIVDDMAENTETNTVDVLNRNVPSAIRRQKKMLCAQFASETDTMDVKQTVIAEFNDTANSAKSESNNIGKNSEKLNSSYLILSADKFENTCKEDITRDDFNIVVDEALKTNGTTHIKEIQTDKLHAKMSVETLKHSNQDFIPTNNSDNKNELSKIKQTQDNGREIREAANCSDSEIFEEISNPNNKANKSPNTLPNKGKESTSLSKINVMKLTASKTISNTQFGLLEGKTCNWRLESDTFIKCQNKKESRIVEGKVTYSKKKTKEEYEMNKKTDTNKNVEKTNNLPNVEIKKLNGLFETKENQFEVEEIMTLIENNNGQIKEKHNEMNKDKEIEKKCKGGKLKKKNNREEIERENMNKTENKEMYFNESKNYRINKENNEENKREDTSESNDKNKNDKDKNDPKDNEAKENTNEKENINNIIQVTNVCKDNQSITVSKQMKQEIVTLQKNNLLIIEDELDIKEDKVQTSVEEIIKASNLPNCVEDPNFLNRTKVFNNYRNFGAMYSSKNNFKKAEWAFKNGIKQTIGKPACSKEQLRIILETEMEFRLNRARCLIAMGMEGEAKEECMEVIRIDTNNIVAKDIRSSCTNL